MSSNTTYICRTCLKIKPQQTFRNISPYGENDENSHILEMLSYSIPELDIFLVKNPVICENCVISLEASFRFKTECLKNEEKLLTYSSNDKSKVDLQKCDLSILCSVETVEKNNNKEPAIKNKVEETKPSSSSSNKKRKYPLLTCKGCKGCELNIRNTPSSHSKVNIGPFECYHCNKVVGDIQILRKHILGHVKPRKCKICHKVFRDLSVLKRHFLVHTQISAFTCRLCNKQFRQKENLKQHLQQHVGSDDVSCNICKKTFSTKYNAKIHMQNAHKTIEVCDLCGETFWNKAELVKHLHSTTESCGHSVKKFEVKQENSMSDIEPVIEESCIKEDPETSNDYMNVVTA